MTVRKTISRLAIPAFLLMLWLLSSMSFNSTAQQLTTADAPQSRPELIPQLGHTKGVDAVAISRDGDFVLTGSYDGMVCLWDATRSREVRRFRGHERTVSSVAFSSDGRLMLTGSDDKTARLWDVYTGEVKQTFDGHKEGVKSVALSSDDRTVVTASADKTIGVWDSANGKQKRFLVGHDGPVNSVTFSWSGRLLVSGGDDKTARVWDTTTFTEVQRLEGHTGEVTSVAISKDEKFVVTGSEDRTARLWDALTGKELRQFKGHTNTITSVAYSPNGQYVLTGSLDTTVRLWNAETAAQVKTFSGHEAHVLAVAFSSDGLAVLTGSLDTTARLWLVETGKEFRRFKGVTGAIFSARYSPDGRFIVTAGTDSVAHLWNTDSGTVVRDLKGHGAWINYAEISPNGRYIVTASMDAIAGIWDVKTGERLVDFEHPAAVATAVFSPDSRLLATATFMSNTVRILNINSGKEIQLNGHTDNIVSIAFSPDGRSVITGSRDRTARIWDVATGNERFKIDGLAGFVLRVAYSPDGRYILTADLTCHLFDAKTGKKIRSFRAGLTFFSAVAFSPDSRYILTASQDRSVRLWDTESGKEVRQFRGHLDMVQSVAFSPGGDYVLTGSDDGTTRIWKRSEEEDVCRLITFTDGTWVVSTSDGKFDTNNLERIEGLHWVMPDDSMSALPVEIFMRPYYESRLLPRLLTNDDFRKIPSLETLNRVQPKVTITEVKKDGPATARVTVQVENMQHTYQRENKLVVMDSGAKDLRLFRDGQLVSYRDGDLFAKPQTGTSGCEPIAGSTKKCRAVFEHIRLPQQKDVTDVEFSAYTFNTSDVKSETFRLPFQFTPELPFRKGRVYLITVGVSHYENPDWNLEFAANDAHLVDKTVAMKLRATGDYDEVVNVLLTGEKKVANGQKLLVNNATKGNFRKIMQLLAGAKLPESETKEIPNAAKIEKATPDDLVLIFYSSHGYHDSERFYLFPYDTGPGPGRDPEAVVPHSISSDDLYQWLRNIDAGDIVLIIDACHAAAVTGKEFKPGPMGSRGMGQLAYDKGMRILAATQPDTTAAEVDDINQKRKIQHGLLTYALVEDGLTARQADSDGNKLILLSEWLQYGVTGVPKLYAAAAMSQSTPAPVTGTNRLRFISRGNADAATQQPSLFDFTGKVRRKRQLAVEKVLPASR